MSIGFDDIVFGVGLADVLRVVVWNVLMGIVGAFLFENFCEGYLSVMTHG